MCVLHIYGTVCVFLYMFVCIVINGEEGEMKREPVLGLWSGVNIRDLVS